MRAVGLHRSDPPAGVSASTPMIQIRCFALFFSPLKMYVAVVRAAVFDYFGWFFFVCLLHGGFGWVFPCVVIVRFLLVFMVWI